MDNFNHCFLKIIFSILFALFCFQSLRGDLPEYFNTSWKGARWITPSENGPTGVFRYKLYLSKVPYWSWLQISATDAYELYINEKLIDNKIFYSSTPSGIYNINSYLKPGVNIIGLIVRRWSFPGKPMIIVKGGYKYSIKDKLHPIFSNSKWKAKTHEDRIKNISWLSSKFIDYTWPKAKLATTNIKPYPLSIPPDTFTTPLYGIEVTSTAASLKGINYKKNFYLSDRPSGKFWLRIKSSHKYDLLINDIHLGTYEKTNNMQVLLISSKILKRGKNNIHIFVYSTTYDTISLYVDGQIPLTHKYKVLKTDTTWNLSTITGKKIHAIRIKNGEKTELPHWTYQLIRDINYPLEFYLSPIILSVIFFFTILIVLTLIPCRYSTLGISLGISYIALLWILSFDIRIQYKQIFNLQNLIEITVIFFIGLFVSYFKKKNNIRFGIIKNTYSFHTFHYLMVLILILILAGIIRIYDIDTISLNGDEIGTVRFALNILKRGFPYIELGNLWKPATTYELLPYPVALSVWIFKTPTAFVVRLPSFIFSLITLGTLFYIGLNLFSFPSAIILSLVYTLIPVEINIAQNARYMQMEQFWALLTIFMYYKGVIEQSINKKYLYLGVFIFTLGYLTWEGFGYILPALFLTTCCVKFNDFSWLKSWHMWVIGTLASVVVFIQLAYRTYWSVSYLVVGTGISDSAFKLMPLYQTYDPWYYFKVLFFNQYNFIPFMISLCSLPSILTSKRLKYLLFIILWISILMANTFCLYTSRYIYYLQPVFLLFVIGVIDTFYKKNKILFLSLCVIFMITTSDIFLKLYKLSPNPYPQSPTGLYLRSIMETRHNIYQVDFRGGNNFVKEHLLPKDAVISVYTHPTLFFAGKIDYFLQSITDTQLIYMSEDYPTLINKTVDVPTIRNLKELKQVLQKHKRVWFVLSSYQLFTLINNQQIINFIENNTIPVYETYRCRIYLWKNTN